MATTEGFALSLAFFGFLWLLIIGISLIEFGFTVYGLYKELSRDRENTVLWGLLLFFVPLSGFLWYFLRYRD